jgi:hypothetical protein
MLSVILLSVRSPLKQNLHLQGVVTKATLTATAAMLALASLGETSLA